MLSNRSCIQYFIKPVCIITCWSSRYTTGKRHIIIVGKLFHQHNVLFIIQHGWFLCYCRETIVTIISKRCLSFLSFLCGYKDYTISGSGTINSSWSCILQDFHAFNVVGIYTVHVVHRQSVNYKKRIRVSICTDTTNYQLGRWSRLTWICHNVHTTNPTAQCIYGICRLGLQ